MFLVRVILRHWVIPGIPPALVSLVFVSYRSRSFNGGRILSLLVCVHTRTPLARLLSTALQVCRGSVLGWCVEWLQAFFLVADDVMDRSVTRRGAPCWYKVRGEKGA